MPKTISICIPVFNELHNLPIAIERVERVFADHLPGYQLEIVVTDNASTDGTWELLTELSASRPHLRGFRLSRNFGYQNSVFAGLCLATGDAVVEVDGDMEDPPEVIPEFVKKWEEGYQVAYGVRTKRHLPFWLRVMNRAFYRLMGMLSEIKITPDAGDFRLIDRRVLDIIKNLPERNLYLRGLVTFVGFRQVGIPYERQPRLSGSSKFRITHYLVLALDAITSFSTRPLRLMAVAGFFLLILMAITATFYAIQRVFFGMPIPGFATLAILSLVLHGTTFVFLGIISEYLRGIFDDTKHRPRVVIAEALNSAGNPVAL